MDTRIRLNGSYVSQVKLKCRMKELLLSKNVT